VKNVAGAKTALKGMRAALTAGLKDCGFATGSCGETFKAAIAAIDACLKALDSGNDALISQNFRAMLKVIGLMKSTCHPGLMADVSLSVELLSPMVLPA